MSEVFKEQADMSMAVQSVVGATPSLDWNRSPIGAYVNVLGQRFSAAIGPHDPEAQRYTEELQKLQLDSFDLSSSTDLTRINDCWNRALQLRETLRERALQSLSAAPAATAA